MKHAFVLIALLLAGCNGLPDTSARDRILLACQGYDKALEPLNTAWDSLGNDTQAAVLKSIDLVIPYCQRAADGTVPLGDDLEALLILLRDEQAKMLEFGQ